MFRLLGFTGMRRGELMALTWEDINFKNKTISIDKTVTIGLNGKEIIQPPKTHSSIRVISIDDRTLSILKNWRVEQRKLCLMHGHNTSDKSQCLFTNLRTNKRLQVQHPNKAMDKICKKYNFKKIKIHGFRHTHCSLLFEASLSIQEVQDRLGSDTTILVQPWMFMVILPKNNVKKLLRILLIILVFNNNVFNL